MAVLVGPGLFGAQTDERFSRRRHGPSRATHSATPDASSWSLSVCPFSLFFGVPRANGLSLSRVFAQVLHSGGPAALADLEGSYAEAFSRGPEAVEFLGRKVDELWQLEDASGAALSGGGGGREGRQARFYTRAAIVCWPRAQR